MILKHSAGSHRESRMRFFGCESSFLCFTTIIFATSGWADGSDGVGAFFVARRPAEAPRNAHRWGRATGSAARAERRCGRRPNCCHRAQPGGDRRGRPDHRRSATSVKWILSVVGQVDPALHCPAQRRRASAARDVRGVTEAGTLAGPRSRHSGFTEEGFTVVDARCLAVSNRGLLHCDR